jgi:NADPH:quinone reductase-like Zn-dependent oxidoreductase
MVRGVVSWSYPHIPGLDVAGVIDALGPGVSGWIIGDAVLYHGDFGIRPDQTLLVQGGASGVGGFAI